MSRNLRRAAAADLRKRASAWPATLTPVPESEWPQTSKPPRAIWRSRDYLVLMYREPSLDGVEVRRLTVNRCAIASNGQWEQDIPWDDLQRCKRETGHGDWYAVEIYPRDRDIVSVANMRHLWVLAKPLGLGWFATSNAALAAYGDSSGRIG
jgi:hypothetical protein